ncbi:hypothetical protein L0B52_09350 [Suttonella sp. R2A3]|uniref:hypothetical protein n=1 Tax=Suttonella sp. R2A3 TaxID=2908648 RepID=UPI001F33D159|nr:hypothetical protein [Suttonella sp. R2A3]UJF24516.1 hypothetical protein L0B52_09350 [Suttonella sp. R2A3]
MNLKRIDRITVFVIAVATFLSACRAQLPLSHETDFNGYYASSAYVQRDQGADWIAVFVKAQSDQTMDITVRSRADVKKPATCAYKAIAQKVAQGVYQSSYKDTTIRYHFSEAQLEIEIPNAEYATLIQDFCSGGATLAGVYHKTNDVID